MPAPVAWAVALLASFLILFHIYIGVYGAPVNVLFLPVHLTVALAILFLAAPMRPWGTPLAQGGWRVGFDLACLAVCAVSLAYFLVEREDWELRSVDFRTIDFWVSTSLVLVVFEAVRRTVGWALVLLSAAFCVHALFADRFPGVLFGAPVSVTTLLQTLFVGDAGIFGIPVLVMAQYIVLFLLFGRLLQGTGAGAFFTKLAFALFGHRVGGPAKAAVVSSALFGTMSGSGVSNVLTTGSFTIPMMTRLGYRPAFAAGVEASAAVGGAIMPPVMGAVAFMMAEFMGVPYVEIAIAAAIPAILYYFAIYWTVHFEARRYGMARIDRRDLPNPWRLLLREGYLLLPLGVIVVMLLAGWSIVIVALVACAGCLVVSLATPETRLSASRLSDALEATARTAGSLSATCACAGIIIGAIFATGLSFQVSQAVAAVAKDSLWVFLVASALIAMLLGTGLTASAVYITMVATIIPILKTAGVPDMAAHMFAFYYGVVSDITPPTALACVAAAGIARANPIRSMLEGSRLGIAAFIVPMVFVASPALLMRGHWTEVLQASGTAAAGMFALSAGLAGFLFGPLGWLRRLALLGAAICLIVPEAMTDLVGLGVLVGCAAPDLLRGGKVDAAEAQSAHEPEIKAMIEQAEGGNQYPPADFGRIGAWAVMAMVVAAIWWMGSWSMHARDPMRWLAGLAILSMFLVIGLRLFLRGVAWRE
ncbi:MAG: TRAP transporter fused permease subunit [Alphaproteobacteria bacterium]|nr:TRAP transporter fused permease subunit [Alphaproteobacteria bacterium]